MAHGTNKEAIRRYQTDAAMHHRSEIVRDRGRNLKSLTPSLTVPNVVAGNIPWYLDTDTKRDVAYETLRALAGPMPQA
jgi:hypothetical protein